MTKSSALLRRLMLWTCEAKRILTKRFPVWFGLHIPTDGRFAI